MSTEPGGDQETDSSVATVRPGRRRALLVWLAGGVALAVVIAGTASMMLRHPDGDPGGIRATALRSISQAVPSDAVVQLHKTTGPVWDSCSGRPGTDGWNDVSNEYQFTTATPVDDLVATAKANLKRAGWAQTSTFRYPLGPAIGWTKTVQGKVLAHALLSVSNRGSNTPAYWDLSASAPSDGQRVSGC